jgi:hypothetical protein
MILSPDSTSEPLYRRIEIQEMAMAAPNSGLDSGTESSRQSVTGSAHSVPACATLRYIRCSRFTRDIGDEDAGERERPHWSSTLGAKVARICVSRKGKRKGRRKRLTRQRTKRTSRSKEAAHEVALVDCIRCRRGDYCRTCGRHAEQQVSRNLVPLRGLRWGSVQAGSSKPTPRRTTM